MRDVFLIKELNVSLFCDYFLFSNPYAAYSRLDYFFIFGKELHRVVDFDLGVQICQTTNHRLKEQNK